MPNTDWLCDTLSCLFVKSNFTSTTFSASTRPSLAFSSPTYFIEPLAVSKLSSLFAAVVVSVVASVVSVALLAGSELLFAVLSAV